MKSHLIHATLPPETHFLINSYFFLSGISINISSNFLPIICSELIFLFCSLIFLFISYKNLVHASYDNAGNVKYSVIKYHQIKTIYL